ERSLLDYTKTLVMEGFLDGQFLQLQQLQDEHNPVDAHVLQFKGSSTSIYPENLKGLHCFLNFCEELNSEACLRCLAVCNK
ncbi:hypothetical protein CFOL_v3_06012, partial [Cephalotus follicularis]